LSIVNRPITFACPLPLKGYRLNPLFNHKQGLALWPALKKLYLSTSKANFMGKRFTGSLLLCLAFYMLPAQTNQLPDSTALQAVNKLAVNKKPPPPKPRVIPSPEFINQPYYYDDDGNRLIKLENTTAKMSIKKKTLGLSGAKQSLVMENGSSKIRFTSSKNIEFILKTGGDEIDLTSFIKLYRFTVNAEKREVVISSNGGILNAKSDEKSSSVAISVKKIAPGNYMIMFANPLEAGEYGFLWVNNMSLQELTVFAFGIDWRRSD
jgi:hypothetical protein